MKPFAVVLLAAAALAHGPIAAEPMVSTALVGSWAVDTSRLPLPPGDRPRSVTITFSGEGIDRLRTKVEVIDPAGARREAEGVTPLDGSPTPVTSNFEADVSATSMPRPEILIMHLARDGKPASTRIYAVSADGKTMIETVAYFRPDGQPVLRENYFFRVR